MTKPRERQILRGPVSVIGRWGASLHSAPTRNTAGNLRRGLKTDNAGC